MNTASILIKTNPKVKAEAQKTAEEMGISLTSVINRYLKHFITTKTITFTAQDEIPNKYMLDSLKQSEDDYQQGKTVSFDNGKQALSYLDTLVKNAKRK